MAKGNFNPQTAAANWVSAMGQAGQKYTQGVQAVGVSPGQSALQNVDAYVAGVQAAVANGSYQRGLQSFTLQDWQNAAVQKGASRLGTGATAAKSRMTSFLTALQPVMSNAINQIKNMPSGTYEANMARQRAFADAMHAAKGSLKQK